MTSVLLLANRDTWPPVPTVTVTRLGRVSPAAQFRFEIVGRAFPAGQIVRKPAPAVLVTVTFRTTAVAAAGTVVLPPATVRLRVCPVRPGGVALVSRMRLGAWAV